MPTVQQGPRGTFDLNNSLIVQEMLASVSLLDPSSKPLTTLFTSMEKAMPSDNAEPQHSEDELFPNIDTLTAASTAGDTTLDVANPLFFLNGDILHFPRTGENARVTADGVAATAVTVSRGVGGAPAALVVGDEVWILGGAQAEGSRSRTAVNTLEQVYTYYCQIIRNSVDATGTQIATAQHGGGFEYQVDKTYIHHKRQLEYFIKWGIPSRDSSSGQWLRTMEGYNHRIQTNRMDVNGSLGEGEFDAFCQMLFQYGNTRKLALCSPRAITAINAFAKGRLVTVPADKSYGMAVSEYMTPFGELWLVNDRELKGDYYGGHIIAVDPDYACLRYLRDGAGKTAKYGGDLFCKHIENIQENDEDTQKDEIFSELTVQHEQERVNAIAMRING